MGSEDHTFTCSAAGLLVRDTDPAGGWLDLGSPSQGRSTVTTRLGRAKEFFVSGDDAISEETITFPDGTSSNRRTTLGMKTESTLPDGTEIVSTRG